MDIYIYIYQIICFLSYGSSIKFLYNKPEEEEQEEGTMFCLLFLMALTGVGFVGLIGTLALPSFRPRSFGVQSSLLSEPYYLGSILGPGFLETPM